MARTLVQSRSSLAVDNLRAVVVLIVTAFHSVVAYVSWMPARTVGFDQPPFSWRAFPVLDSQRWLGFDIVCAWQDVYLMAMMFLLSGLFVWPGLSRKQNWGFTRDRLLRLGVPFLFGIFVLVPISEYPAYLTSTINPSLADYWREYTSLPFWPNGQVWFLWQLLAASLIVVVLNVIAPNAIKTLGRWLAALGQRPLVFLTVLVGASAIVYVPVALAFTPWAWTDSGPLSFQYSRPLLYLVYFFAGIGIGATGIENGLLAGDGLLARRWWLWLVLGVLTLFLWMGVTYLTLGGNAPIPIQIVSDLTFVVACAASCAGLIAASLRFSVKRSPLLASVSNNAYSLYLLHYSFAVWMQYALLDVALPPVIKGLIVFTVTMTASWLIILAVQRLPLAAELIGAARPRIAQARSQLPTAASY